MTFCMNVSRFMNLAAIFSLDLESQYKVSGVKCQASGIRHQVLGVTWKVLSLFVENTPVL